MIIKCLECLPSVLHKVISKSTKDQMHKQVGDRVGSITSRCSEREPALLPRTLGEGIHRHERAAEIEPSIAYKVCEKIVKKRVINFWQSLGIFNPIQFGFLEGKSTVTQLLTCYNDWASSRNKSTPTDVVFLDFTKAFDSVPHERLLLKLKGYGIEGNLLHWFRNFLTNRQQRVRSGTWHLLLVDPCEIRSTPGNNPWAHFISYFC